MHWLQLACTLYEVSRDDQSGWFIQAYTVLRVRRNQSTSPEILLIATFGEVIEQKASHQS